MSDDPLHPYTRSLHDAVPVADPTVESGRSGRTLTGEVPDPAAPPPGCRFHPRCPIAEDRCRTTEPPLRAQPDGDRLVACHLV
jgi:oligopeptide/dipeptide ABC transporter ATP-binding protein